MKKVVYLHGFASSPGSSKARFFAERLRALGVFVTVPDLAEGDFEHLTISRQLALIERLCEGEPVTIFGSSMGGYLASLYAARHPEVVRLVLLAPAFGLARRWVEWLGNSAMEEWRTTGRRMVFHYGEGKDRPLWYGIIEDGLQYEDFPDVRQPVLILQGTRDEVVPARVAEEFAGLDPVRRRLRLVDSGHELTDVFEILWEEAAGFTGFNDSWNT